MEVVAIKTLFKDVGFIGIALLSLLALADIIIFR